MANYWPVRFILHYWVMVCFVFYYITVFYSLLVLPWYNVTYYNYNFIWLYYIVIHSTISLMFYTDWWSDEYIPHPLLHWPGQPWIPHDPRPGGTYMGRVCPSRDAISPLYPWVSNMSNHISWYVHICSCALNRKISAHL